MSQENYFEGDNTEYALNVSHINSHSLWNSLWQHANKLQLDDIIYINTRFSIT